MWTENPYFQIFIIVSAFLIVCEPILCGVTGPDVVKNTNPLLPPSYVVGNVTLAGTHNGGLVHLSEYSWQELTPLYQAQICVLSISTALFLFGVFFTAYLFDVDDSSTLEKVLLTFSGIEFYELLCFLWGWIFIFIAPGVAALRCFRIFRLLHYLELESPAVNPHEIFISPKKLCHICLGYFSRLSKEV